MNSGSVTAQPATALNRITAAPLFLKLTLWLAATFVCTTLVRLALWGLGYQDEVFGHGARMVTLIVLLIGLRVLVQVDPRPTMDFGMAFSDRWARHLVGGMCIGVVFLAAYYAICHAIGAMRPPGPIDGWQWFKFLVIVPPALILALAGQIIFSGYLFDLFRSRHGAAAAVIAPALILPLAYRIDTPQVLLTWYGFSAAVGMMLLQVLCGLLRLRTGDVMLAGGLSAGVIAVQRTVEYGRLLRYAGDGAAGAWLAPQGDPWRSPVVWGCLVLGIVVAAMLVQRRGPAAAQQSSGLPLSLKRIYPFSVPMMAASLDVLLSCLNRARWRIGSSYAPRLAAMLLISAFNTILTLPERLLAPLVCRRRIKDPIFIVGVHRSGTTHLHNLLSLDPNLIAPRNFHVLNPHGFLLFGWPMAALMAAFFPSRRPMDAMHSHLLSTNEEEFAIANLCPYSPYWGWVFPRQGVQYDRFLFPDGFRQQQARKWRRVLLRFLAKLVLFSGRRPVLKNPCNCGRAAMLMDMFPEARFIHIRRDPYDVYRSNMHFARQWHCLMQLQDPPSSAAYSDRFLELHVRMEEAFYQQTGDLPPDRLAEITFEDLERDPVGEIRRLYRRLGLKMDARFRLRLGSYLRSIAGYRKNLPLPLAPETQGRIAELYAPLLRRWGQVRSEEPTA